MPQAAIVASWQDATHAYLALRLRETIRIENEPSSVDVEYLASLPLAELAGRTAAQKKALLVGAVRAQRDGQRGGPTDLGMSGSVAL